MLKRLAEVNKILRPSALYKEMFPGRSPLASRSPLNNLYIPKIATENLSIKQLTDLEKDLSDHKLYTKPTSDVLAGNVMKKGSSKENFTNNAFGLNETFEEYRARLERLADTIVEKIRENPNVNNLSFQEAPIKEDYEYFKQILEKKLPGNWKFYNSAYGVLTALNTDKYQCEDISESIQLTSGMDFGPKDNRYKDDRFRSFKVQAAGEEPWILTNLHVPHDSPQAALKNLFVNLLKYHLDNIPRGGIKHVICGDWNATPAELDAAYEEACAEIEEQYKDKFSFIQQASVVAELASSVNGHQKALKLGQERPDVITVDGMVTININSDSKYSNRSKHVDFDKTPSVGIGILLLTSMGMLLSSKLSEKKQAAQSTAQESTEESEDFGKTSSPKNP